MTLWAALPLVARGVREKNPIPFRGEVCSNAAL